MTVEPKRRSSPQPASIQPQTSTNPAVAELSAIREELIEMKKKLIKFRRGLTKQVASGVALASLVLFLLTVFLQLFTRF
jgi:hypothetical protein